jgi:hypothetical protein
MSCSYCGKRNFEQVGRVKNSRVISLIRCNNCKLVSTNYFPNENFLNYYYAFKFPHLVQKYNVEQNLQITFSKPDRFAKRLLSLIPTTVSDLKEISILDFGGGDGTLAIEFAQLLSPTCKVHITVVDFGNSIAQHSLTNISLKKFQNIPSSDKYDLIIASASVELIADFGKVLRSMLHSLRGQDSCMYVRTNYILPIKKIVPLVDFTFPAHLHDIGPDFWKAFQEIERGRYSILKSETPISELDFRTFPLRWIFGSLLKLPSRVERKLFPKASRVLWKFVGSWEVVISKNVKV